MEEHGVSRYYLLMDYLVPVFKDMGDNQVVSVGPLSCSTAQKLKHYRKSSLSTAPKTTRILEVEADLTLYAAYFDIDVGHFVVKAKSRRKAYDVATLIRALYSLYFGWQPDERTGYYFLQELKRLPQPNWNDKRLLTELETGGFVLVGGILHEFRRGYIINNQSFNEVPLFIKSAWGNLNVIESLNHMLESRFLFCGFMVGSYYALHYSRDRESVSQWEMEKKYFEDRLRYETAFLAAFKGIERFFAVSDIKKHEVDRILDTCKNPEIKPQTIYTRYHEVFSGLPREVTYHDLILHFLALRNILAAHGNRSFPEKAKIIEDNVFEIQLFLLELLSKAIFRNG